MNPVIQLPPCAFHPFPILRALLRLTATGHDGEKHRSNLALRYHPPRAIENFAETREGRVKEATTRRLGSLVSRAPCQIISILRQSNFHLDTFATFALSIHRIATNARSWFLAGLRLICLLMLPYFSLFSLPFSPV